MTSPHTSTLLSVFAVASALAVAGCKVGPDYAAPAASAPDDFTHIGPEGYHATSLITTERPPESLWWETLGDPTLNTLIDRALVSNLDLRLAEARIREARALRGVVAPEALPQLNVNGLYERRRESAETDAGRFGGGLTRNSFELGFDATWEIDVFGGVARAVEATDADIESTIENRRDVMVILLSEVARNYIELRGFQNRLDIARRNIDLQRQTLELTESRFRAGLTNEVDVAQARSILAATESAVPLFDIGTQRAINRLGVLLGLQPTALLAELTPIAPIPVPPAEIAIGVPSELLRRRPDVRRAERDLAAATARIGVATADLFPRFALTGSFGHSSDNIDSFADSDARFWSFGPALRWPIFNFGRVRAAIGVEDARTEQALVRYEQIVLTSLEDAENAMLAFTREQDRRRSLSEAVAADRRAFDLSNQLYTNGLIDFLRVLDSQRALRASEDQLVDSERAVTTQLVALYKALGGGWEGVEARGE